MRFFSANIRFMKTFKKHVPMGQRVIDAGCGEGHLSKLLKKHGYNVQSYDKIRRAREVVNVIHLDVLLAPLDPRTTVLVVRPDHGGWVSQLVEKALTAGAQVVYVSKEHNIAQDLGEFMGRFKAVEWCVGKDQETFAVAKGNVDVKVGDWVLVNTPSWGERLSWVEDGEGYWINASGGRCPKSPGDTVFETASGDVSYDELDHRRTGLFLVPPETKSGWLSPTGEMYFCEYECHDRYADLIIKKSQRELEKEGWVKISANKKEWQKDYYPPKATLTEPQADKLMEMGFIVRDIYVDHLPVEKIRIYKKGMVVDGD